jgi:hypothetical protein
MMTLDEAEAWLREQADPVSADDAAAIVLPRIYPAERLMWGPDDYADWTRDQLIWRLVFLQCAARRAGL